MTENRKIAEKFLDIFSKVEFDAYNVEFFNGYLFFDFGKDSVVHFRVNGVWKKWKFGIWINSENKTKTVQLFVQYEDFIDKFKPSSSDIVKTFSLEDLEDENNIYFEVLGMLRSLKNQPILCMFGAYSDYMIKNYFLCFLKIKIKDFIRRIK